MRGRLFGFLACIGLGLVGAVTTQQPAPEIVAKKITVTSDDGNVSLVIQNTGKGVGLWLTKKDAKPYAYMYASNYFAPYMAIGNGNNQGDPVAFVVDENGDACVQVVSAGATGWYKLADVVNLLPKQAPPMKMPAQIPGKQAAKLPGGKPMYLWGTDGEERKSDAWEMVPVGPVGAAANPDCCCDPCTCGPDCQCGKKSKRRGGTCD